MILPMRFADLSEVARAKLVKQVYKSVMERRSPLLPQSCRGDLMAQVREFIGEEDVLFDLDVEEIARDFLYGR